MPIKKDALLIFVRIARTEGLRDESGKIKQYIVIDTPRDGNCLFHALSIYLYKTPAQDRECRSAAIGYLKQMNRWQKQEFLRAH